MMHFISVTEAAAELGISRQRVSKLCEDGTLTSTKVGKFRFPHRQSIKRYQERKAERLARAPKYGPNMPTYLRTAPHE
jgi:excisionase family DNA binding protein